MNFILPTILIGAINAVSQQNRWQTGGKSLKIASATAGCRPNADNEILQTYRLALSCNGECTQYFGGTACGVNTPIENTSPIVDAGSGTRELCKCQGLILYRWWPDVFLVKGYAA
ncbi:MAG TPA: hypothetical protein VK625_05055 [Flavitalea sp.]|nr:hypothetical protein [Flavitalea sp.]